MKGASQTLQCIKSHSQAGFTLIEMMVAIAVLAILMVTAILTIPNHDERYWRDNLNELVSSLNLAQEEASISGVGMLVQIDSAGWRFAPNALDLAALAARPSVGFGTSAGASSINASAVTGNGTLPDVYREKHWHKPVMMESTQLSLNTEPISTPWQITIVQDQRTAILRRSNTGRFSWVDGGAP
jgi:type II secretion system protein H